MENNYSTHNNKKSRRENSSANIKMQNKLLVIILRVMIAVILIGGFSLAGGVVGAYIGIIQNAPEILGDGVAMLPDIYTTIFYDAKTGEEIDRLQGDENREYITIDKVPQYLRDAFVAIEDERFYDHDGVDIKGLFRALYVNLTDPDRSEGASTITQQLIKNSLDIQKNTFETKLQEQYLAIRYEKQLVEQLGSKKAAKDYILEVYLNMIGLHYNMNGVKTAALYYFGKDVSELTLSESAVIAGITNKPSKYNPIVNPEYNDHRRRLILENMLRLGMITEKEHANALDDGFDIRRLQTVLEKLFELGIITEKECEDASKGSLSGSLSDDDLKTILEKISNRGLITEKEFDAALKNGITDDIGRAIFGEMLELGMITEKEFTTVMNTSDGVYDRISQNERVTASRTSYHSYFIDETVKQVLKDLQDKLTMSSAYATNLLYNGGLQIYVTQDQEMQKTVDEVYADDSMFPENIYEVDVEYNLSIKNSITGKEEHYRRTKTVKTMDDVNGFVSEVKNELISANDNITGEQVFTLPQPQSGMVIMDYYTGEVKAMAGGRGEKKADWTFNRATEAERQPGSVFKVLASYAPALDLGLITPATVYDDAPVIFEQYNPPYEPKNWDSKFIGNTTVRDGIAHSMNILAIKNLMNTGFDTSFSYLLNFGFTTLKERVEIGGQIKSDKVPSMALGGLTTGVTQLELTAAFGAIANGGEYLEPILYTQVLNHDGKPILENVPDPKPVLKKQVAYLLTNIMQDVITSSIGTGGRARFQEVKMPIAGKTGTTSETRDLMFAGYTPYYVSSIYLGFDQPKEIKSSSYPHLVVWRTIMERIHEGLPEKGFEQPDGIAKASICKKSGLLAAAGLCDSDPRGSQVRSEIFVSGTQPTEYCNVHVRVNIDTSTNMLAGDFCPQELVTSAVRMIKPGVQQDVTADRDFVVSSSVCTVHNVYNTEEPLINGGMAIDDNYYVDENGQLRLRQTQASASNNNNYTPMWTPSPTPTPTPTPIYVPEYAAPAPRNTPVPPTPTPRGNSQPFFDDPQW